jgi:RNA polymerase sigma factor for flagellar operon FliA
MTVEDFKHYGVIGLIEAKKKYDRSRGIPWLAFAALHIRWRMVDAIRKGALIRLPQEKQQMIKKVVEAKADLVKTGKKPDAKSVAEKLGWTVEQVEAAENLAPSLRSMAEDRKSKDSPAASSQIVLEDPAADPEQAYMKIELANVIQACLEKIAPAKIRWVLVARFIEELTFQEIGKLCAKSIETVRQWQLQALEQMKACLEHHGWSI